MGNARKLTVKLRRDEAIRVTRVSIRDARLCYVIVADKRQRYKKGRSGIVYIGTTTKGVGRLASSAAQRASEVLGLRGVRSFTVRVVSCKARQGVRTWSKLERALLLVFKEKHGQVPHCNSHGKGMKPRDEFEYFHKARLLRVLEELA
jgi:hypothetical protein